MDQEYSRSKEKLGLRVEPKLITVDGVDGSGTSAIADELGKELESRGLSVKRIHVPQAGQKAEQEILGDREQLDQKTRDEWVNIGYFGVTRRVFMHEVAAALGNFLVVIVTSSDVKNAAIAYAEGHPDQVRWVSSGSATAGIKPGFRVFIKTSKEIINKVMQERIRSGTKGKADPKDDSVATRIRAFKETCDLIIEAEKELNVKHETVFNDWNLSQQEIAADLAKKYLAI